MDIPAAPLFEPEAVEGAVWDLKVAQNEKLVIKIKEHSQSSKVSSDDGRKTRVSYP
jgi:hypothetical protein